MLAVTVQTGVEVGGCCHAICMVYGLPVPEAFVPETEYVRVTADASVVVQVLVVLEHPLQTKVDGEFVQNAVSVRVVFTAGLMLLASIVEQTGRLSTVGGGWVALPPHSTVRPTFGLVPALLTARSA